MNKMERLLKNFKRKKERYYEIFETTQRCYIIIDSYNRMLNTIVDESTKITQYRDVTFGMEPLYKQAFIALLEDKGYQKCDSLLKTLVINVYDEDYYAYLESNEKSLVDFIQDTTGTGVFDWLLKDADDDEDD